MLHVNATRITIGILLIAGGMLYGVSALHSGQENAILSDVAREEKVTLESLNVTIEKVEAKDKYDTIEAIEEDIAVIAAMPEVVIPSAEQADEVVPPIKNIPQQSVDARNEITIPKMGVHSTILEGDSVETLNNGIWHIPGTSNPADGGNVVISAHRYKWLPPSTKTFWHIDKLEVGDEIYITWEGKDYTYRVANTEIVTPDRVDILQNTAEHKLTLFSCTPKYTSKYRLVVEAYPVEA